MGTRITLHRMTGRIGVLVLTILLGVVQSSKVWDEVVFPEDTEAKSGGSHFESYLAESDDEDFAADVGSGVPSGEEEGSTPEPPLTDVPRITTIAPLWESPAVGAIRSPEHRQYIYYRALVNFTNSFQYGPEMEDIYSPAFQEITAAVVDTLESEYHKIPGQQTVSVVLIKKVDDNVFVELDVGSEFNANDAQIRRVLFSVVQEGSIASYVTSVEGFQFRRLGTVVPTPRTCMPDEFSCQDGGCIPMDFHCDKRPDCDDMSDEVDCVVISSEPPPPAVAKPTPASKPALPPVVGPCNADQATCQNGQCIPRDYLCDGETDCADGSDEIKCGTPSPCEPNEFKCQNGRCALKLWRCDGDNDCGDNSDESYCPTKGPGDTCAPEQFVCLSDRTCIPASYQCDEESDCPDRSDEYGCTPPVVTSPPEESITARRGETVTFTCVAVGVPTPIITWRLNWGHVSASNRITMTSENGHGTLVIRDVKDGDQGAYTCEAINAKGMVFGIPDGVLMITHNPDHCPDGHFSVESGSSCIPCFCFGITRNCQSTGRYRNQIRLRFTEEDDFKGVNVSFPSRPSTPPLSSTQIMINPEEEEFQLLDLSRRFLNLESFWTLPSQFLGNKVDSYGGYLKYKVRYTLARGETEPVNKPDVILVGNGQRLVYRRTSPAHPRAINQREIKFTEENWQHSSGHPVTREDLMMTLVNLESISLRTVYDNRMVSVALSDIVMDITIVEFSTQGIARDVEECRCPPGYSGLSCETCASGFERVSGGSYLGTCSGCNCNGHASACDPVSGHCLSCQHNTEGPQCDRCRTGYFGNPSRGRPDDCKPCPCPYTETSRRFSDTCFLDHDSQATCDACRPGYTGRRCEKCAPGYHGNPLQPNGKCLPDQASRCDNRGTVSSSSRPCTCKANVVGALCDECKSGSFHLSADNPEGCLQCFCMGVTKQCASSTWSRDQVQGGVNGQLFILSNGASTRTIKQGISQRGSTEVVFRSFTDIPSDIYYWVLPESFRGDKVTAYGGELRYTVRYEPRQHSVVIDRQPDVVLQGNDIFLEHFSKIKPLPRVPTTVTVPFRESAWKRADGQPCTREHLLMALADTVVFMIRATYADSMAETSISDIRMDIAVPHSTGSGRALEVEECACPQGYRGPSCQECDIGYTRIGSGLYLGTCERCDCHGHASSCDPETGTCLQCLHNTDGPRCDQCKPGFYGNPKNGDPAACQPCPCLGVSPGNQYSTTCYLDTDGQPTCDGCPAGYTGRRCERYENTSTCQEPLLHLEHLFPLWCDEPVYNVSDKSTSMPNELWNLNVQQGKESITAGPIEISLSRIPSRSLLASTIHGPAAGKTTAPMSHAFGVGPGKTAPRVLSPHTANPEVRHRSLQLLLRHSMNRFNRRLSMLEGNSLDIKEALQDMTSAQVNLSSHLNKLASMLPSIEKQHKIAEMERNYASMESRQRLLEDKLEILIDGFTALALEVSELKQSQHSFRSPPKGKPLSLDATIPLATFAIPSPSTVMVTSKFTNGPGQKVSISTPTASTRSTQLHKKHNRFTTAKSPPKRARPMASQMLPPPPSVGVPAAKATMQRTEVREKGQNKHKKQVHLNDRLNPTPKTLLQGQTPLTIAKPFIKTTQKSKRQKLGKTKEPSTTTQYQLVPPSQKAKSPLKVLNISKPSLSSSIKATLNSFENINNHKGKNSPLLMSGKKTADSEETDKVLIVKKSPDSRIRPGQNSRSQPATSFQLVTPSLLHKSSPMFPTKSKKSAPVSKGNSASRRPASAKKAVPQSRMLDLLKLLQGNQKPRKKQDQDSSLHIVLGRLAIPIKIIPD